MSKNWHGGKGSQYRPVDYTKFSQNWDKAFGKAEWLDNPLEGDGVVHDKCGTPDCCGMCDSDKGDNGLLY